MWVSSHLDIGDMLESRLMLEPWRWIRLYSRVIINDDSTILVLHGSRCHCCMSDRTGEIEIVRAHILEIILSRTIECTGEIHEIRTLRSRLARSTERRIRDDRSMDVELIVPCRGEYRFSDERRIDIRHTTRDMDRSS